MTKMEHGSRWPYILLLLLVVIVMIGATSCTVSQQDEISDANRALERYDAAISFRRIAFDRYIVFGNVPESPENEADPDPEQEQTRASGTGSENIATDEGQTPEAGLQLLVLFVRGTVDVQFDPQNVRLEPVGESENEIRAIYSLPAGGVDFGLEGAADPGADMSITALPFEFVVDLSEAQEVLREDTTQQAWQQRVEEAQEIGALVGAGAGALVGGIAGSSLAGVIPGPPFRRLAGGVIGSAAGGAAGAAGGYLIMGQIAQKLDKPYDELSQSVKDQLRNQAKRAVVAEVLSDGSVRAQLLNGFENYIRELAENELKLGSVTEFKYEEVDFAGGTNGR